MRSRRSPHDLWRWPSDRLRHERVQDLHGLRSRASRPLPVEGGLPGHDGSPRLHLLRCAMSPEWIDLDSLPTDADLAVCRQCDDTGCLPDNTACEACPVAGDEWDALAFAD